MSADNPNTHPITPNLPSITNLDSCVPQDSVYPGQKGLINQAQFVSDAIRTESIPANPEVNETAFANVLTLAIASATFLDLFKKNIYYGKPISQEKMKALMNQINNSIDMLDGYVDMPEMLESKRPITCNIRLLHAAIGMFTESGEILEALEKDIQGIPLDKVNFQEELGDINWYEAIALDELGADKADILRTVIAKLKLRYPNKFESHQAINRDLDKERQLLDNHLQAPKTNPS